MTGRALALALLVALLGCASAYALRAEVGNTVVSATADATPRELPTKGGAPVRLTSVTRAWSKDGSMPPALSELRFEFDKHGRIVSRGVPVCTLKKLQGTTPTQARRRCAGALVGKGVGKALVELPGQEQTQVSSPLSFFNGPKRGGRPSLIVHAYERVPEPKALLVPIEIERVKHGRYGWRVEIELPEIAGGYGAATLAKATLGRTFKRQGKRVGYVTASCVGGRLQVHGLAVFANGDFFPSTLSSTCHPPR